MSIVPMQIAAGMEVSLDASGLPMHAAAVGLAGSTAATAIDLTEDDEDDVMAELERELEHVQWPGLGRLHPRPIVNATVSRGDPDLAQGTSLHPFNPPTMPRSMGWQQQVQTSRITRSRQLTRARTKTNTKIYKRKQTGPDLQILDGGHRTLKFWKDKYFKELGIDNELTLATNAAQYFEKSSIQTVVPNRYFRRAVTSKRGRRRTATFPGDVQILSAGQAVHQAYEEHTTAKQDTGRLVLWTDGSKSSRGRGFAVAWRRSTAAGWGRWQAAGYKVIGTPLTSDGMEHLGVIKALEKAREIARHSKLTAVSIYTDSTTALHLARQPAKCPLGYQMVAKARLLRKAGRPSITLHWCPGHSRVRIIWRLQARLLICPRCRAMSSRTRSQALQDPIFTAT